MAQMTALRRRMIDDMTVRNLSPATQQSYVYAVANQILAAVTRDHLGIAVAAGDFVFSHPIPIAGPISAPDAPCNNCG